VISFTVETDGRLPSGQELRDAVAEVDAATDGAPAYYMVNCAHPTHFENVLAEGGLERVRGLRANASMKSLAELDEAEDLDQGDPDDLAERYRAIPPLMPGLNVVGGCCGTDERHIEAICSAFGR
jgi:S-methylmethionine-dependent homocysteine/selenocysteine methylase